MARQPYSVGDVFQIPLDENGSIGYGRIIKIDKPSILIELYKHSPADTILPVPILIIWSTDTGFKKGMWQITSNIPVPSNYRYPVFYSKDAFSGKIVLVTDEGRFEASEDQIRDAQPAGIFGHEAVRIRFLHELNHIEKLD